jgi:hypothetical protein
MGGRKRPGYQAGITKTDYPRRTIFGWAYVTHHPDGSQSIDVSEDFMDDTEELLDMAHDFVKSSRQGDAMHKGQPVAELVESVVVTPDLVEQWGLPPGVLPTGWWVGLKVNDEATWQEVVSGRLRSFSIGGRGYREPVLPDGVPHVLKRRSRRLAPKSRAALRRRYA